MTLAVRKLSSRVMTAVGIALTMPALTPLSALVFSVVFTTLHSRDLVDFGISASAPYNAFIWHFAHRSHGHSVANIMALAALFGTGVWISVLDILILSAFAMALGVYDLSPFYGASGLVFYMVGKLITKEQVLSAYNFAGLPIKVPYLTLILLIIFQIHNSDGLTASVEILHLFSFLFGCFVATMPKSKFDV